jgi:hypothetical protein
MKLLFASIALVSCFFTASAFAQAPAAAPAGSTALCKDGSYTSTATKRGACSGHKGIDTWYGATADATPAPAAAPAPTPPGTKPAPAPKKTAAATPAPGGGPGQVWVNTKSKVYHCPGTRFYGTTKQGEYMTEAAAKAAGDRADHGKACSS